MASFRGKFPKAKFEPDGSLKKLREISEEGEK